MDRKDFLKLPMAERRQLLKAQAEELIKNNPYYPDEPSKGRLKDLVLDTFLEYGGWWKLPNMAEWLGVKEKELKLIWDELETEGLLERKPSKAS